MSIKLDASFETVIYSPICAQCKHLIDGIARTCAAYTAMNSIPTPIWNGENDHTRPYPGDNGIRFEALHADDPHQD